MTDMNNIPPSGNQGIADKLGQWARNSVVLRLIAISILVLLLLIPMAMIKDLIREREDRKDEAIREITSKWADAQFVAGPLLTVPYVTRYMNAEGKVVKSQHYLHITPRTLDITSSVVPQVKHRGMFKAVLYSAGIQLSGTFDAGSMEDMNLDQAEFQWEKAFISIQTDMGAISNNVTLHWGDDTLAFRPSIPSGSENREGIHVIPGTIDRESLSMGFPFSIELDLKGSSSLMFAPVGRTTRCDMQSTWPTPSFDGTIVTDTNTVSDEGFTASWTVLEFNRNMPNAWTDRDFEFNTEDYEYWDEPWLAANGTWFGLRLHMPADTYQQSMRTAKYAILFIVLTFTIFFIIEILNRKRIHAIQYVLVGLALTLFYSLLLAVAEFTSFDIAYVLASLVIIIMITAYTASVFSSRKHTWVTAAMLVLLYTYIYVILQQSDIAFLLGNIGLLLALGAVMYFTRRLDWYSLVQRDRNERS